MRCDSGIEIGIGIGMDKESVALGVLVRGGFTVTAYHGVSVSSLYHEV